MISCLIDFLLGTPAHRGHRTRGVRLLLYYQHDKRRKLKVPHDPPWPLVGNTLKTMTLIEHQLATIDGINKRFAGEKYCGAYQQYILIKDFSNFVDRGFHKDPALNIIAKGLFFMEGPEWKVMRQKLSPGFTSGNLKLAHNQIAECSDELSS
ncbi:unnamed protein product [Macrosiphum euphorbiae]|uniref:Cytochrome P450 n=1 Tax=Macrosiphum euphorbiae TaxID=13131 RepID=A0AAV0W7E6_9HEMI|nr:unnamed protein product [Macrosiphum euphorbiae]